MYLSISDFVNNGKVVKPNSNACFSSLFSVMNPNRGKANISIVRVAILRDQILGRDNLTKYSKEDIIRIIKSLGEFTIIPEIIECKIKDLPETMEVAGLGCEDHNAFLLTFDFTGINNILIKFMLTFTRYFYENQGGYVTYTEILDKYVELMDSGKYSDIPNTELFQLAHYDFNCSGGHGMMSTTKGVPFKIVTNNKLVNILTNGSVTYLNGCEDCIFKNNNTGRLDHSGVPLIEFIEKHRNESNSNRPE